MKALSPPTCFPILGKYKVTWDTVECPQLADQIGKGAKCHCQSAERQGSHRLCCGLPSTAMLCSWQLICTCKGELESALKDGQCSWLKNRSRRKGKEAVGEEKHRREGKKEKIGKLGKGREGKTVREREQVKRWSEKGSRQEMSGNPLK